MSTSVRPLKAPATVMLKYRGHEDYRVIRYLGTLYTFMKGKAVEVPEAFAAELVAANGTATGDPAHAHIFEIEGGEV